MKIQMEKGPSFKVKRGTTIAEVFAHPEAMTPPFTVGALLDNRCVSLATPLLRAARLAPVTMRTMAGRRIYQKSLTMVLVKAFRDLFPDGQLRVLHSLSKGIYCSVSLAGGRALCEDDVVSLKLAMQAMIAADLPFHEEELPRKEASRRLREAGLDDRAALLEPAARQPVQLARLDGMTELTFSTLVPTTGMLKVFDLVFYPPGMILRFPRTRMPDALPLFSEQTKLFGVFHENAEWLSIIGAGNAGELNMLARRDRLGDAIKVAEALHEKKVAAIADQAASRRPQLRFVLIAGPSSSGKTTFAKRLAIQLRVLGLHSILVSTDDYFRPREETPRDENGEFDFEGIEALDTELFNDQLTRLANGETVRMPRYRFDSGSREEGPEIRIDGNTLLIVEGIHCLNESLTRAIPLEQKFLIYISALTQLNLDNVNRIPTTENRLIRRIVRDNRFRGYSAAATIQRWPSVRAGEDKNIFPFQERADAMFNSSLIYEFAVLKHHALPLLARVKRNDCAFPEAERLRDFLNAFESIPEDEIPPTSLLREFIGGSAFRY